MKKKKISAGLVSGFIAALALTACSGVTASDTAIVTYKGYDGEQVNVLTNTVYNKYRQSSDGIAKFYSAILESIIRYEFDSNGDLAKLVKKPLSQIKTEAQNNVTGAKQKAEENAKTNNTSYSEEWDSILSSYGVEDEDELLEYFIYQLEKEELEDSYFKDNKASLTKEYIGVDDEGNAVASKAKSAFPYHIRHVLVSVSDGASDFYKGVISSEQAKNLGNVIDYLMDSNYTFAEVAKKLSGDEGSAAKGGDVGIMTPSTSFVNEFKLGIYAYDAILSGRAENTAIVNGLGFGEEITLGKYDAGTGTTTIGKTTIKDEVSRLGLAKTPYDAFVRIGKEAETELVNGKKVNDGNANYYPRNVYWNNYLNLHNPFVITNQKLNDATGALEIDTSIAADDPRWTDEQADGLRYLTDEAGHIIIGVRGSYGIHLMIMQKSIYDFNDGQDGKVSLEDYYTTYVPGDAEYPTYDGKNKSTYVNYITTDEISEYNTRASEIKSAIKSFDSTYDYRLYELLTSGEGGRSKITFNNTDGIDLGDEIAKYIEVTRQSNKNSATNTLTSSWKDYLELINGQNQQRDYTVGETTVAGSGAVGDPIKRVVNIRCAIGFTNGVGRPAGTDWQEGGMCYYEE